MVQSFPADSVFAFLETGLGKTLAGLYSANQDVLHDLDTEGVFDLLAQAGVKLPTDLITVFGDEVAAFFAGTPDDPQGGVRVKTADPDRARTLIANVLAAASGSADGLDKVYAPASGGYTVGIPEGFVTAATTGKLGASQAFRDAVPDAHGSPVVVYVDVNKAIDLSGDDDLPAAVRQFKAFGMTASTSGRDTTLRIRLTFV